MYKKYNLPPLKLWSKFRHCSLSLKVDWIGWRGRGWHQVDYNVKFVLFTLIGLKVKIGVLRVKFVKVCK